MSHSSQNPKTLGENLANTRTKTLQKQSPVEMFLQTGHLTCLTIYTWACFTQETGGVTLREELCYNCKNLALNKGHQNPKIRIENSHPNAAFISRHFCFLPLLLPALSFASFIAEGGQSGVTSWSWLRSPVGHGLLPGTAAHPFRAELPHRWSHQPQHSGRAARGALISSVSVFVSFNSHINIMCSRTVDVHEHNIKYVYIK